MIRKILKLQSKDLQKNGVEISFEDALQKDMVIGLGDSQLLLWLDELRGADSEKIQNQYNELKMQRNSGQGNRKELTCKMRELEFITELVQVEFTNIADFDRLVNGFYVNGAKYVWLMSKGSNVITFIREDIESTIRVKLNNGRNEQIKFIPAKLNAYMSLTMSSSRRVSQPTGKVIIVPDNKTTFVDTYLSVTTKGIEKITEEITLESSDGNGIISPRLMEQWSKDMGYDHMSSGVSIRNSFVKGMLIPFPMDEFFEEHGITHITDSYGKVYAVEDIDMILTESMFKLWQSYDSYEEYERNCKQNGYEFRVCKESHEVKGSRANYQMTQDMVLTDEQIEEMLRPSINHLQNISGRDWLSTVLYLNGQSLTENSTSVKNLEQALMIEPRLINDKHTVQTINKMTNKRKQDLCLGRFNVSSNYQIICSDIYHLLESVCGIDGVGLLKKGEVYSKWHVDRNHEQVVLYRSPMISKENIAQQKVVTNDKIAKYYRYATELVVMNDWDLTCEQLAGADKDGDTVLCLADKVLNEAFIPTLPVKCEACKGEKVTCDNINTLIKSSRLGCNDKYNIGVCINHITCMFAKRSEFEVGSKEYEELSNRALLGLMISQSYIDFKKLGQVVMEMPKKWYDLKACDNDFDRSICANKKSYFMLYNNENADIKKKFIDWKKSLNIKTVAHWNITIDELLELDELTEEQEQFLEFWSTKCPIQLKDNSTQHRICKKAEEMLKEVKSSVKTEDYSDLLKCKDVVVNDTKIFNQVNKLYELLSRNIKKVYSNKVFSDDLEKLKFERVAELQENFVLDVIDLCNGDRRLATNILIDVAYKNKITVAILWKTCGDIIVENLLQANDYTMMIPVKDDNGSCEYLSEKYTIKVVKIEK